MPHDTAELLRGLLSEAADELERVRAELRSTQLLVQYLNDRLADFEGDTHGRNPT